MVARLGPERAFASVKGDFAIAWRDGSGQSIAAVDRFGSRTLCYRLHEGQFVFADRADALAGGSAGLDPQALFDYLYFHVIPSPRTIFGVYRLPPGHFAVCSNGNLVVKPYLIPTFEKPCRDIVAGAAQEFRELLKQAVGRQLDDSRPACFLSGGTDSSTVAGMIGEVTGQPAATYSIGFEAEGYDEMDYARIAARHFGTEHHEYYVTPDDLVRSIADVAASYDQPFGNSSALPAYYCALQAREDGVTRLLAGDGGDELFGGNSRYAKQRVFGWYQRVPGRAAQRPARAVLAQPGSSADMPLLTQGLRATSSRPACRCPTGCRCTTCCVRLGLGEVLTPGVPGAGRPARRRPGSSARSGLRATAAATSTARSPTTGATRWPRATCRRCAATAELAGVDVGFPLLDDDLLDFSLRLPADYKLKGLKLRWFFKEALRGFLPDEIIAKKKHGFGLPFGVWVVRHAALRALATDSLRSFATRGIVRPEFIAALLETPSGAPGYYGEMVWILMMLEQWLRRHTPDYRFPA